MNFSRTRCSTGNQDVAREIRSTIITKILLATKGVRHWEYAQRRVKLVVCTQKARNTKAFFVYFRSLKL
jgi:hypothetical protein